LTVLNEYNFQGLDRKAQLKPNETLDVNGMKIVENATFILKWGGVLTDNGKKIAYELGT